MNQPPGTLTYTGQYTQEPFAMELFVYTPEGVDRVALERIEDIEGYRGFKWLNVVGICHVPEVAGVGRYFDLSDLLMEDIFHVWQRSRLDIEKDHLFSIHKMIYLEAQHLVMEHLSMVVMKDTLVTFQEVKTDIFNPV